MKLPRQFRSQANRLQVRPPDFVEQRDGMVLQVWGEEGYWQVVDEEFRDLLRVAEHPTALEDIFTEHPDWAPHRRSVQGQLANMEVAGVIESHQHSPARIGTMNRSERTNPLPRPLRKGREFPDILTRIASLHLVGTRSTASLPGSWGGGIAGSWKALANRTARRGSRMSRSTW